ncbi:MAG: ABC transporter permease [Bacteroidia bacterium]|nr:ABC transporter permease [Bacteroidia bacterium]
MVGGLRSYSDNIWVLSGPFYSIYAPFFLLTFLTALGIGIILSVINLLYRDMRQIMPFALQLWMYISPVVYPTSLMPDKWRNLYSLNPMVGIIDGFRWSLTGKGEPLTYLSISVVFIVVILVVGLIFFHRYESKVMDML